MAKKRRLPNPAAKHIRLYRYMFQCPAYRALKPVERCALHELMFRYNGQNNGDVGLSVREAAELVHSSTNTAQRALSRLQDLGFIRVKQKGSFDQKARHSTRWILTMYPYNNQDETKDFMRWKPEAKNKSRYQSRVPSVSIQSTETPKSTPGIIVKMPLRSQMRVPSS